MPRISKGGSNCDQGAPRRAKHPVSRAFLLARPGRDRRKSLVMLGETTDVAALAAGPALPVGLRWRRLIVRGDAALECGHPARQPGECRLGLNAAPARVSTAWPPSLGRSSSLRVVEANCGGDISPGMGSSRPPGCQAESRPGSGSTTAPPAQRCAQSRINARRFSNRSPRR